MSIKHQLLWAVIVLLLAPLAGKAIWWCVYFLVWIARQLGLA